MVTNTKRNIDRTYGSEAKDPTLLIAASAAGHETVLLGHLNSKATLRVFAGGYRILVKTKANTWLPGRGVDDSSSISLRGSIPELVIRLTGEAVSKDGEELLSMLPESGGLCHMAMIRRDEGRLKPLPYVGPEMQELRKQGVFRGY